MQRSTSGTWRLGALAAVSALFACSCGPGEVGRADPDPISEKESIGRVWSCAETPYTCEADYLAFPDRARDWARPPEDCEALRLELQQMEVGEIPTPQHHGNLSTEALTNRLVDGTHIGFLLDGLAESPLSIEIISDQQVEPEPGGEVSEPRYRQLELLIEDPFVATTHPIQALLLLPEGPGPHPAVVAMPGHHELAADHRDRRYGKYFPQHGYALLILSPRAYGDEATEDHVSQTLLCEGFTFLGLRIYEALLGLRYLRWRPDIDANRVGLIGHSGGSVVLNALVRIDSTAGALVTDLTSQYLLFSNHPDANDQTLCLGECYGTYLVDETAPGVFPYAQKINDFSTVSIPVLQLPYGYGDPALNPEFPPPPDPDDPERYGPLFQFFDNEL